MAFVIRDTQGTIVGVYNQPVEGAEEVAADDAGLLAFVQATAPITAPTTNPENSGNDREAQENWQVSDLTLVRVMEDLIDILINKNVVNFTDFPPGAQKKLLGRRGLRSEMAYLSTLFEGADEDFDESGGGGYL